MENKTATETPVPASLQSQPIAPQPLIPDYKTPTDPKLGRIKVAFLYVLIGGLIVSALISVIAILIGQFNEVIVKALLTTFIFVTHSLLILALISADRNNTLGKTILPTTIFVAIIANMFTATLGTWGVWSNDISGRAFSLYTLAIGAAFIVNGALKLRIAHRSTNVAVYTTVGLTAALVLALIPWVLSPDVSLLGSFYYRLIGVIAILGATSLSLSVILNRIAVSQNPQFARLAQLGAGMSGGLMAIYIIVGSIVGFFWIFGLTSLIASASYTSQPKNNYNNSQYNSYN